MNAHWEQTEGVAQNIRDSEATEGLIQEQYWPFTLVVLKTIASITTSAITSARPWTRTARISTIKDSSNSVINTFTMETYTFLLTGYRGLRVA